MNNRKRPKGVSVPLRGLWFLSADANGKGRERLAWFPSPCGDYGSYLWQEYDGSAPRRCCFRPLAGIMVLINFINCGNTTREELVSVPLRGLWFLSRCTIMRRLIRTLTSFRPLAGIMVLITWKTWAMVSAVSPVSVPLRGLWFLS